MSDLRVNDHDPSTCHVCRVVAELLDAVSTRTVIAGLEGLFTEDDRGGASA
jgi:hypothetical protein